MVLKVCVSVYVWKSKTILKWLQCRTSLELAPTPSQQLVEKSCEDTKSVHRHFIKRCQTKLWIQDVAVAA